MEKKGGSCLEINQEKLVEEALCARQRAYVPYSHFAVGAALLCGDGTLYHGANIECASYPGTNCAERTAVFKAVSEGRRDFAAIAVVGGPEGREPASICPPCGICRQVLREFCQDGFPVILSDGQEIKTYTLGELLPCSFGPENL